MPTYEYECTKCNRQFEYFQSISEAPKKECESCGGELVKLLSAGSGLIFKGSGFYITDYKSSGGEKSSGEAKPATESKTAAESKSAGGNSST